MKDSVIKVENLSKVYRIGLKEQKSDTLGGAIAGWVKSPAKNFKKLRNLSSFDHSKFEDDAFWALSDISFEVGKGDVLGIIGRNGAGKSTLLKILSRITEPTKGEIRLKGRVASLLEVGTGFNPELTGRENIYLNGTILGMTRREIDKKFDEIVAFSGVEKFIDTPVKRYSSGMKVRLGFAVAAHLEPEILIVDEVLAVGDAEFQSKCIGKMQDVSSKEGRTVLFVSHDLTAVEALCGSILYLKNGKTEFLGPTSEGIEIYNSNFGISNEEGNYVKVDIINDKGQVSEITNNIDELVAEITISRELIKNAKEVDIELKIRNSKNIILSVISTWIDGVRIGSGTKDLKVRCKLDKLPFIPSDYFIDLLVIMDKSKYSHFDAIKKISIVSHPDNYNIEKKYSVKKHGNVIVKHVWDFDV